MVKHRCLSTVGLNFDSQARGPRNYSIYFGPYAGPLIRVQQYTIIYISIYIYIGDHVRMVVRFRA